MGPGVTRCRHATGMPQHPAVDEQRRDQCHLDPERAGGQIGVEIGQHQEESADQDDRDADEHDAVHATEAIRLASHGVAAELVRRERGAVGGNRHTAAGEKGADMREPHGALDHRRARIDR